MGTEEDLRIASRARVSSSLALPPVAGLRRLGDVAVALARFPLPLFLIVAVAFAAAAIFARSVHEFYVMPDELGYVKQAIAIAQTGLPLGPHAFYFNSWAQLLPAISAPIFGGLSMPHAFYVAHTVLALLLASTAVPAFLLARELRLRRFAAYLVAALSVAIPQLVIAGEVVTDVVAYPVFAWAVLASLRALDAPSPGRDAVAIAAVALAFFARTQFFVLGPILVVAAVVHDMALSLADRRGISARAAIFRGARQTLYRHRLLWGFSAAAGLVAVVMATRGDLGSVLGHYAATTSGNVLPAGALSAGLQQLDGNVLGIGVVPFTLAVTWALASLRRPRDPARHAFAVLLVLLIPVFLVMVGSFRVRFMAGDTDRYLFYLAPLLFAGAAMWVVDGRGSLPGIVLVGGAVVWLLVSNVLHPEGASIINPSFYFHRVFIGRGYQLTHALGLPRIDPRILIAIVASAFTLLAVALRQRLPSWQALLAVTLPLLAYGVVNTAYTMTKLRQDLSTVPASNPTSQAWIDRAAPSSATVGDLIASGGTAEVLDWQTWWNASFWNKSVSRTFILPGGSSLAQGFVSTLGQDLARGRLTGLDGVNYLVKLTADHRFGLRAGPVAQAAAPAGSLALYKLPVDARLQYGTNGVNELGELDPPSGPFVRIFSAGGSSETVERVILTVKMISPGTGCPCRLNMGPRYGEVRLPHATSTAQPQVNIIRTVTAAPGGYAQLDLDVRGRSPYAEAPPVRVISIGVAPTRRKR